MADPIQEIFQEMRKYSERIDRLERENAELGRVNNHQAAEITKLQRLCEMGIKPAQPIGAQQTQQQQQQPQGGVGGVTSYLNDAHRVAREFTKAPYKISELPQPGQLIPLSDEPPVLDDAPVQEPMWAGSEADLSEVGACTEFERKFHHLDANRGTALQAALAVEHFEEGFPPLPTSKGANEGPPLSAAHLAMYDMYSDPPQLPTFRAHNLPMLQFAGNKDTVAASRARWLDHMWSAVMGTSPPTHVPELETAPSPPKRSVSPTPQGYLSPPHNAHQYAVHSPVKELRPQSPVDGDTSGPGAGLGHTFFGFTGHETPLYNQFEQKMQQFYQPFQNNVQQQQQQPTTLPRRSPTPSVSEQHNERTGRPVPADRFANVAGGSSTTGAIKPTSITLRNVSEHTQPGASVVPSSAGATIGSEHFSAVRPSGGYTSTTSTTREYNTKRDVPTTSERKQESNYTSSRPYNTTTTTTSTSNNATSPAYSSGRDGFRASHNTTTGGGGAVGSSGYQTKTTTVTTKSTDRQTGAPNTTTSSSHQQIMSPVAQTSTSNTFKTQSGHSTSPTPPPPPPSIKPNMDLLNAFAMIQAEVQLDSHFHSPDSKGRTFSVMGKKDDIGGGSAREKSVTHYSSTRGPFEFTDLQGFGGTTVTDSVSKYGSPLGGSSVMGTKLGRERMESSVFSGASNMPETYSSKLHRSSELEGIVAKASRPHQPLASFSGRSSVTTSSASSR